MKRSQGGGGKSDVIVSDLSCQGVPIPGSFFDIEIMSRRGR